MIPKIAILGIDGSGKTSAIEKLRRHSRESGFALMRCPDFHLNGVSAISKLSEQLALLSQSADEVKNSSLKFAALFLRMTLFGLAEKEIENKHRNAKAIVQERHALLDAEVYTGLYTNLNAATIDQALLGQLTDTLSEKDGSAWASIQNWIDTENKRLGTQLRLENITDYCRQLFDQGQATYLKTMAQHFQTSLPTRVIFLDVPVDEALRRIAMRNSTAELHENKVFLTKLRNGYLKLFPTLHKNITVERLAGDTMTEGDVAQCIERAVLS